MMVLIPFIRKLISPFDELETVKDYLKSIYRVSELQGKRLKSRDVTPQS